MPADPALVKKYLASIEADRQAGRVTVAPPRLHPGNILGGQSDAFIEAVKQQGQMLNPAATPAPANTWGVAEEEQKRRDAITKGLTGK